MSMSFRRTPRGYVWTPGMRHRGAEGRIGGAWSHRPCSGRKCEFDRLFDGNITDKRAP